MWSPGLDFQAGAGQAAVDQVGSVLDLFSLRLMMRTTPAWSVAAKLAIDRLSSDQMPSYARSQPTLRPDLYEFILVKPRRQSRYVTRLPAILAELCRIVHR